MCIELKTKLDQYGIEIYDNYVVEDEEVYNHCEKMIIIYNKKEKKYAISFDASCKPEIVGNMMIILQQLNKPIEIMESYTYNQSNIPIFGDEAYEQIKNDINKETKKKIEEDMYFQELLSNITPDDCFKC